MLVSGPEFPVKRLQRIQAADLLESDNIRPASLMTLASSLILASNVSFAAESVALGD